MSKLTEKNCKPCEGGVKPYTIDEVKKMLHSCKGWIVDTNFKEIKRVFEFKNYYRTIAFVNAIAWIAHRENHHPDLEVHYNNCVVRYTTHAIGGLSENDFICAAKTDEMYRIAPN